MQLQLFLRSLLTGCVLVFNPAYAESDKPISVVVGYSPGGSADLVARAVSAEMGKHLGRQIVVENTPGASGMLAAQKVINAPADGALIYMGGTDTVVIPMVNAKTKLNWEKDLAAVGRMTTLPMIFAVTAKAPYNNLSELFGALNKGKTDFTYATPGTGTMQHLYGALIDKATKTKMVHVPYRGGAQITTDLVGGHVNSAMLVLSTAMPFLKDGTIKALSISDSVRSPLLPNVKRIGEEEGFAGLALPLWQGLFVKAGTPPATLAAYEKALLAALASPEVQSKLKDAGITTSPLNGKDTTAFVKQQAVTYLDVVTSARIALD
nr:tripartite tricarboxylate transporter substrate binding protein [uncultured Rhodoferax sp.]